MSEVPCPVCREECPIERLDKHVEIIDCCDRKWVVKVDGKWAARFAQGVSDVKEE